MTCKCAVCNRFKEHEEHLSLLQEPDQTYFRDLLDNMYNVEADNDYYKAIMQGQWPSGEEVLQNAMNKYHQKPLEPFDVVEEIL